jgi:ubiquinone/menaquinone biosynthesis C-methylase UbiE
MLWSLLDRNIGRTSEASIEPQSLALDQARQRAHMPHGTATILDSRTLATAHRRLAQLLHTGLRVLDVGCGTGAVTRGIAEAVAPDGLAVGLDINAGLLAQASRVYGSIPGLAFAMGDIYTLPCRDVWDVVTAARVLQWLASPLQALRAMRAAVKPGGWVVTLDYNHERIVWEPAPPPSMQHFYRAFLRWRAEAGMDNTLADRLAHLSAQCGLVDIVSTPQHEVSTRNDPDFYTRLGLWAEVAASRGHQMVVHGILTETQRATAEAEYRAWVHDSAAAQTLYLLAVEGRRPS